MEVISKLCLLLFNKNNFERRQLFKNHNFVFLIIEFLQGPHWHRIVGSKGKNVPWNNMDQYKRNILFSGSILLVAEVFKVVL